VSLITSITVTAADQTDGWRGDGGMAPSVPLNPPLAEGNFLQNLTRLPTRDTTIECPCCQP